MTLRKIYIGSVGPFLFDDTDSINDPDGDFAGEDQNAVISDGPIKTTYTAITDDDLVRKADIDNTYADSTLVVHLAGTENITGNKTFTGNLIWPGGTTGSRPGSPAIRQCFFDETLGIPIWYDGTNWINAIGATV